MNVLALSHRRAQGLIDERLDEERGEGLLDPKDAAWLDEHLRACDACRAFESDRRKLLAATSLLRAAPAPDGFAARVLAAKARGVQPSEEGAVVRSPFARFGAVGAIAAAALIAIVAIGTIGTGPGSSDTSGGVGVSGTGALEQLEPSPHFVVRAPGLGPAKARAQAVSIIDAHDGAYEVFAHAIYARIPRDQLVAVMRDLAKQSRYKVSRADAGELDPSLTEVIIKFELE